MSVIYGILTALLLMVFAYATFKAFYSIGKLTLLKTYGDSLPIAQMLGVKKENLSNLIQEAYESIICFTVVSYFTITLTGATNSVMSFLFLLALASLFCFKYKEEKILSALQK